MMKKVLINLIILFILLIPNQIYAQSCENANCYDMGGYFECDDSRCQPVVENGICTGCKLPQCGMPGNACCTDGPECLSEGFVCKDGLCIFEPTKAPKPTPKPCDAYGCTSDGFGGYSCDDPCIPVVDDKGRCECQKPQSTCGGPTQACCTTDPKCYMLDYECDKSGYCVYSGSGQANTCDSNNDNKSDGIMTAIGCISVQEPNFFVSRLLTLATGIGGGITFLLIIFGALQILTSSGNPDKIQAGKELITSAIAGLLLIIFSVFILRLIAGGILQIPGFE